MNNPSIEIISGTPELSAAQEITVASFGVQGAAADAVRDRTPVAFAKSEGTDVFATVDGETMAYACGQETVHGDLGKSLYIVSVMVHPSLQQYGVGRSLLQRLIADTDPYVLGFRTQSPNMYRLGQSVVKELYPKLDAPDDIPEHLSIIGHQLAEEWETKFPIHPQGYGEDNILYRGEQVPNIPDDFRAICDPSNGDSILCIGEVRDAAGS